MERLTEKDSNGNYKIEVKKLEYWCTTGDGKKTNTVRGQHIDRLAEYENLEEQGKLLKLPCAVGDTVYEINHMRNIISEFRIKGFRISEYGVFAEWSLVNGLYNNLDGFNDDRIGDTVFITKEQAEAALGNYSEEEWKEAKHGK